MKLSLLFFICLSIVGLNVYSQFTAVDKGSYRSNFTEGSLLLEENNPTIALEYFKLNVERAEKLSSASKEDLKDKERTKAQMDSLVMDNANLRIAANYLKKYKNANENNPINNIKINLLEVR